MKLKSALSYLEKSRVHLVINGELSFNSGVISLKEMVAREDPELTQRC